MSLGKCQETSHSLDSHGYGQVKVQGKTVLAHRLSWTLHKGPIPKGKCVLHKCDNRKCIRISHLFLGTKRDNALDMYSKGRGPNNRGTANGRAKLTSAQVQALKNARGTYKDLAARFGVSKATVWRVRAGISH